MEHDILQQVAGTGKVFAFLTDRFWMSIKSAGSAIYANRVMLGKVYRFEENMAILKLCSNWVFFG